MGLRTGSNRLTARLPDGSGARLRIDNHPIGGPIFSGTQIQPWYCTTAANGLAPPTDAKCDAPARYSYEYKSSDPAKQGFQPYDPASPPADVATARTDQGKTVPLGRGRDDAQAAHRRSLRPGPLHDRHGLLGRVDWSHPRSSSTSRRRSAAPTSRLDRDNGNHDNQVIWTYPAQSPLAGVFPDQFLTVKSFLLMDRWLSAIHADDRRRPRSFKVEHDKPAGTVDACFTLTDTEITNSTTCRETFPHYADARIAAGGPLSDDIVQCRLQPLTRSTYAVKFTDVQWAQLNRIFPHGVCNWKALGLGEQPSRPWTTFAAGPGGRRLGPPPRSTPLK